MSKLQTLLEECTDAWNAETEVCNDCGWDTYRGALPCDRHESYDEWAAQWLTAHGVVTKEAQ